jgi:hypothetical protein
MFQRAFLLSLGSVRVQAKAARPESQQGGQQSGTLTGSKGFQAQILGVAVVNHDSWTIRCLVAH